MLPRATVLSGVAPAAVHADGSGGKMDFRFELLCSGPFSSAPASARILVPGSPHSYRVTPPAPLQPVQHRRSAARLPARPSPPLPCDSFSTPSCGAVPSPVQPHLFHVRTSGNTPRHTPSGCGSVGLDGRQPIPSQPYVTYGLLTAPSRVTPVNQLPLPYPFTHAALAGHRIPPSA